MQKIVRWLRVAFVSLFALAGAQLPKISQDYQRQFAVRCSEVGAQMQKVKLRAADLGETPNEYIRKHFLANIDQEVAFQGQLMQENWDRSELMKKQLERSQIQKEWLQPFYWFFHQDFAISRDTWKSYEVGFIYTSSTLIWGFAGVAAGWLLLSFARLIIRHLFKMVFGVLRSVKDKATGSKNSEELSNSKDENAPH